MRSSIEHTTKKYIRETQWCFFVSHVFSGWIVSGFSLRPLHTLSIYLSVWSLLIFGKRNVFGLDFGLWRSSSPGKPKRFALRSSSVASFRLNFHQLLHITNTDDVWKNPMHFHSWYFYSFELWIEIKCALNTSINRYCWCVVCVLISIFNSSPCTPAPCLSLPSTVLLHTGKLNGKFVSYEIYCYATKWPTSKRFIPICSTPSFQFILERANWICNCICHFGT